MLRLFFTLIWVMIAALIRNKIPPAPIRTISFISDWSINAKDIFIIPTISLNRLVNLYCSNSFLILLYLLFFSDLKDGHRDLINILVGAYVGVLAKSTDYWFKDKDDAEDKESQQLHDKKPEPKGEEQYVWF